MKNGKVVGVNGTAYSTKGQAEANSNLSVNLHTLAAWIEWKKAVLGSEVQWNRNVR